MIKVIDANQIRKVVKKNKPLKANDTYAIIRLIQKKYPDSVYLEFDNYYRIEEDKFLEFCQNNQLEQ